MGQVVVVVPPSINNNNVTLGVLYCFAYLRATITSHLSLGAELSMPINTLYCEYINRSQLTDRPCLRYQDTCKRDMKMSGIDTNSWETADDNRRHWRLLFRMTSEEEKRHEHAGRENGPQKTEVYKSCPFSAHCLHLQQMRRGLPARVGFLSHAR